MRFEGDEGLPSSLLLAMLVAGDEGLPSSVSPQSGRIKMRAKLSSLNSLTLFVWCDRPETHLFFTRRKENIKGSFWDDRPETNLFFYTKKRKYKRFILGRSSRNEPKHKDGQDKAKETFYNKYRRSSGFVIK